MSMKCSSEENRIEKVQKILSDVHFKTEQERADVILSFVQANLTVEEIDSVAKTLRPNYLSKEDQWVEIERQRKELQAMERGEFTV